MPANPAYLHDLLNQPQALRDTIAALRSQSLPAGLPRRIVLTGMGSSYHVFHPLQQALVNGGVGKSCQEG